MTIEEYYKLLKQHDWYYEMSSDPFVFSAGLAKDRALKAIARDHGPKFQELYQRFKRFYFSGPAFGVEKEPFPELEEFIDHDKNRREVS